MKRTRCRCRVAVDMNVCPGRGLSDLPAIGWRRLRRPPIEEERADELDRPRGI